MACIPFKIVRICDSQFKCNNLKNQKLFLNFLFDFLNLYEILNILKEKMIVTTNELSKLHTVKNFVRALPNKRHSWTRFDSQHVKASQILAKYPWERLYHFFNILIEFGL